VLANPPTPPAQRALAQRPAPVAQTALANPPTPTAQTALLTRLGQLTAPLLAAEGLVIPYTLRPGLRLRSTYGRCRHRGQGLAAEIQVRCTADGDRLRWRPTGSIVATLLHELAHLRWRSHGPRFWSLQRRLVDAAVARGIYDPADRDPHEHARGDEKLTESAASTVADAARAARRERARAQARVVRQWPPGSLARVATPRGRLAGMAVRVVRGGRTRLLVESADRRQYWVPAPLLRPFEDATTRGGGQAPALRLPRTRKA
jgi:WLM domain-containing protein